MKYRKEINDMELCTDLCIAFGRFDGVHRGHRFLLETLAETAIQVNAKSVAISYCESLKEQEMILTTEEEKAYLIEKTGIDYLISYQNEMQGSYEEWIKEIVFEKLRPKYIVTSKKDAHIDFISQLAKKNNCTIITVEPVCHNGQRISSKILKQYFKQHRFEELEEVCGHYYVMIGEVVHGRELGRTVGMPTVNLGVSEQKLKPPSGVYASEMVIDGNYHQGLTNIGTRPTVDDLPTITIETFLLDFSQCIYGKKVILEVHLYIRGVQKFNSLQEVQQQVQKDIEQVKEHLNATHHHR